MELWTAFLLGFVGSLHCAGMCGPLALALPVAGKTRLAFFLSRLAYNAGRIVTYGLLGVLFGALGATFALAGLQRWVSVAAGVAILAGLLASSRYAVGMPVGSLVAKLKAGLGKLLRQRSYSSLLALGMLNGLLPCGLVYVACAAAAASTSLSGSVQYMLMFGLGTVPMMLGIGLIGRTLSLAVRLPTQKLITMSLAIVAVLLILRGLSLGIPYVSPDLSSPAGGAACCH